MSVCPRCPAAGDDAPALVPGFGALLEDVCPRCRGRFLAPAAVERVIVDELGVSEAMLREMVKLFASKERLTCPSCASKLSAVHVRNVRVDLCTGCGGAWLDGGELTTLTSGRHAELSPAASPAPSAAPTTPTPTTATPAPAPPSAPDGSGRLVVFFEEPELVTREQLAAAFTQIAGLAPADAAQIAAKRRPTALEGATEGQARAMVTALADAGVTAHVADESWLSLPPAYTTSALTCDADKVTLGRADASIGRVEVPWAQLAAIATGQMVRSSMQRTATQRRVSPARMPHRQVDEVEYDVAVVEKPDVFLELVLSSPPRRYRLTLSTMIFGVAGRPRQMLLNDRLAELVRLAPSTVALGRGVRAAAEGRPLPRFSSQRDLERELGWLLWRSYR